jgi:hypothetical protein
LSKLGLLNKEKESAHDIGLIVGGSETQPIHFDVPSLSCEEDQYERVMNLPYAPASILLGLRHATRLTIRKSDTTDVERSELEETCAVAGGIPDEKFLVVGSQRHTNEEGDRKEETEVVVLESKHGFVFRGDFKHAGSPTVKSAGVEFTTWTTVLGHLRPLLRAYKTNAPKLDFTSAFTKLCEVPMLNTITRMHVQLIPKNETIKMPDDAVGVEWESDKQS